MHIIINGNYLSLDNILTISKIRYANTDKPSFEIIYHTGKECNFYYTDTCEENNGELWNTTFYFKNKDEFMTIHERIMSTLNNATEFNTTSKKI